MRSSSLPVARRARSRSSRSSSGTEDWTMTHSDRRMRILGTFLAAALATAATARAEEPKGSGLREAGLAFEAARLLPEAERAAGLQEADRLVTAVQRGARNEEEDQAARYLWAQ